MMLAQMLLELSRVEDWLHDTEVIDNIRPVPWRVCPDGCGCRWGTMDADRSECGCGGPCCGSDDDTWFSRPLNELADLAIDSILTLIHHTHDVSQVGAIVLDRVQIRVRAMVNGKVKARARVIGNSDIARAAQRDFLNAPG